ncbi:MAG TPA: LamG-like jellyroll fold domain-containing protein, partial [Candidatus Binatia bacterium]|nr:LamG-like jellyroll fold domain-containing protein [Candidatus Binatia bacterium]
KFLPPEIRSDVVALDDLRRETARSHKLTHANIVRIHDLHEEDGGLAFIAMEYVDGPTLSSLGVEQPGRVLAWDQLKPLVQQLCAALDYAHSEKVIHRDLKPSNIMVDSKGRLKLADFGIAATVSDSVSRVSGRHATSGTLPYMSPQQVAGKRPQVSDDIYALGATLYELLSGKPPFYTGDITHQVLHEPPEPLDERMAGLEIQNPVPPDVAAIVMACLAKEPAQRPQSARAVAEWIGLETDSKPTVESLGAAMFPQSNAGAGGGAADAQQAEAAVPAARARNLALVANGVVAVLLLASAGIWYFTRDRSAEKGRLPPTQPADSTAGVQRRTAGPPTTLPARDGLVLYFSFDQPPENGVVRDESGLGNDGHVVGAQWTPQGRRAGAFQFDPTNSYIRVPNNDSLNPSRITLAAWIKTSRGGQLWRRIFDKDCSNGIALSVRGEFTPGQHRQGKLALEVGVGSGPGRGEAEVDSDGPVNDGLWHHVVTTCDGDEARCYVDGKLQASVAHWQSALPRNSFDLTIGINLANPNPRFDDIGTSFDGVMDEVMIFNRALSADEVRQLYGAFAGPASDQPAVGAVGSISGVDLRVVDFAGQTHAGSADGPGADAQFRFPCSIATDETGTIYVTSDNTIRKITPAAKVSTIAGLAGEAGANDGPSGTARFNSPNAVGVNRAGILYVADSGNHTIRTITPSGRDWVVSTFAGLAGSPGSADGLGSAARFSNPKGLAVDHAGNLYVADSDNNAIRRITATGQVSTLAGMPGRSGSADGPGNAARFNSPRAVAVDTAGNVLVADWANFTVRKVTPAGVVSTFAGLAGKSGSADGPALLARFNSPRGLAVDNAGNIYVADFHNSTIRRITPSGAVSTLAGLAGRSGSLPGTGSSARLFQPCGVVVNGSADLFYIADTGNHLIRKGLPGGAQLNPANDAAALSH